MENKDKIEIPFGAKDSELCECEYTIPEGYEAEIKDGKVIIRKVKSEDERIRKAILDVILSLPISPERTEMFYWLDKQADQKPVGWKPSEEQMDALHEAISDSLGKDYHNALSLLDYEIKHKLL